MGYKIINTNEMTYVIYKQRNMLDVNQKELSILEHNMIPGLMNAQWTSPYEMQYIVPKSTTLKKFLSNGEFNNAISIINSTICLIKEVNRYNLITNQLILDLDFVFVNDVSGDLYYIYEPYRKKRTNNEYNLFFVEILKTIKVRKSIYSDEVKSLKDFVIKNNDLDEIYNYIRKMPSLNYDSCESIDASVSEENSIEKLVKRDSSKALILNKGENTIGRMEDNTCVIKDSKKVSRYHAIINIKDGAYIKDVGSKNGTYLNNRRIMANKDIKVSNGDIISFGDEDYIFVQE